MLKTATHPGETRDNPLEHLGTFGQTVEGKLDDARLGTADALTGSATSVRDAAGAVDQLAKGAAAKLDSTAAYLRSHDSSSLLAGVRQVIRRHPTSIVAAAIAVGVAFGITLRRD